MHIGLTNTRCELSFSIRARVYISTVPPSDLKGRQRRRETHFYKINNVQKKEKKNDEKKSAEKVAEEYSAEKFLICLYGKQPRWRSGK